MSDSGTSRISKSGARMLAVDGAAQPSAPAIWLAQRPCVYLPVTAARMASAPGEGVGPARATATLAQLRYQARVNRFAGRLHPAVVSLDQYEAHSIGRTGARQLMERPACTKHHEALTARELEVLQAIAAGRSNAEIASELVLSVGTIKWHLANIYGKLGARRRTQALAVARERGLLR